MTVNVCFNWQPCGDVAFTLVALALLLQERTLIEAAILPLPSEFEDTDEPLTFNCVVLVDDGSSEFSGVVVSLDCDVFGNSGGKVTMVGHMELT